VIYQIFSIIRQPVLIAAALALLTTLNCQPVKAQEPFATYPQLPLQTYSSIKVFDYQGRFAGRLLPEKRYWVSIDRIPLTLQKAVVAVEDARFYAHGGIDMRGIARAAVKNVVKGRLAEGGSTITQQLVKNKYLTSEKSIDRKVNEALIAIELEKKYKKKQILEMYFNEIYYGNGAWGIAQASRLYFDKYPEELTDAECVLLAGVQKNPGRYNPLGKPMDVGRRRDVVLKRMTDLGIINQTQRNQLRNASAAALKPNQAPYYLALIRAKLIENYGAGIIDLGGLEVTASVDLNLQILAEQTLREGVTKISPELQGALVSIDPATGDLRAVVGGTDAIRNPYNRAVSARRQPGSSIKPLIYAYAVENGANPADIWNDAPVTYNQGHGEPWLPMNYDGKSHGDMSLRQALATSNNVIAVKLLDALSVTAFAEFANRMGLSLKNQNDLTLALGTEDVSLHELTLSYAPLANNGIRPEPRSIIRIYDSYRHSWVENPPSTAPVISPATAFVTTSMLKDVLLTGTARGLKKFALERPSAGKTGTTNDYRDAWFIGYTPQLVTGVWVGYDKPRPGGKGFTGGAIAAPIWERFMRPALTGRPVVDFLKPDDVVTITVDPNTGYIAADKCPTKKEEMFVSGSEPSGFCPKHGGAPGIASPVAKPLQ
jgi:penicillin-binding protein 2D